MKAITRTAMIVAALATVAGANANSISTIFLGVNSGSAGGGVYFDVAVGANPILITGFDVNTTLALGGNFGFRAFTHLGTYVGTTATPGLWTQVASGTGVAAGLDQPSVVTLDAPFQLAANTIHALALTLSNTGSTSASHRYTNGNGSNQFYSNADLSLTLGAASNVFMAGTPFSPRVWNGTIHYNVVPEPGTFIALGFGLAGLAMLRRRK